MPEQVISEILDPSPVVGLLNASLLFLGSAGFVHALGGFEVIAAAPPSGGGKMKSMKVENLLGPDR